MKITQFVVLCIALVGVASAFVPQEPLFAEFMKYTQKFQKVYESPIEFLTRYDNFVQSHNRIMSRRAKYQAVHGKSGDAVFGYTKFSDLSPEEFRKMHTGFVPSANRPNIGVVSNPSEAIPTQVDWRKEKKVTPVKDQGQCGSCWAFSATEQLESAWAMRYNKTVLLSVQQTVSCDTVDAGCDGGDTITAYQYIQGAGGVESEADYPYTSGGGDTGTCDVDSSKEIVTIANYSYATPPCTDSCTHQNEDKLATSVATYGPVSICVDAEPWQDYTSGVLDNQSSGCQISYSSLDHCVQIVGYNKAASPSYWIVRNSWNTDWGIDGYIYLKYGSNTCGVADEATLLTAKPA